MKTRVLLARGAIADPIFTVAWIVEGVTRASYNSLRHPVSSLALGDLKDVDLVRGFLTRSQRGEHPGATPRSLPSSPSSSNLTTPMARGIISSQAAAWRHAAKHRGVTSREASGVTRLLHD